LELGGITQQIPIGFELLPELHRRQYAGGDWAVKMGDAQSRATR
jgi:hypothetical protein